MLALRSHRSQKEGMLNEVHGLPKRNRNESDVIQLTSTSDNVLGKDGEEEEEFSYSDAFDYWMEHHFSTYFRTTGVFL